MSNASSTQTVSTQRSSRIPQILRGRDTLFVGIFLLVLIGISVFVPNFASPVTTGYLLLNAVPALLIALPMTLIIITGEIDLSVASIVGLSAATIGSLTLAGWPFLTAAIIALVVGVVVGAFNGFLIAYVGLPSLAVTIGTLALFRGLTLVLIGDNSVPPSAQPEWATEFVSTKFSATGVPVIIVLVAVVIALFALVLHATPFGRGLYALGFSKEAARFVGINVQASKFWLYVSSGFICALVGIFWSLYYSARSDSAMGLELTVIAAVLFGGVSIFGGRGSIVGATTGVLLIASVTYAMRLQRIPDVTLVIVTGVLLIASVVAPSLYASIRQSLNVRRVQSTLPRSTGSTDA